MRRLVRSCLAMTTGALPLAAILLVAGVPGAVLLALAPALLCVGMHLLMDHGQGDAEGRDLLETARRASHDPRP
jgi:4-hydroxybenzoate polyprenyltransferase